MERILNEYHKSLEQVEKLNKDLKTKMEKTLAEYHKHIEDLPKQKNKKGGKKRKTTKSKKRLRKSRKYRGV